MSRDSTVVPFRQPDAIDDPLTEVAREGARRLLAQVLMRKPRLSRPMKDLKLPDGRDRVVRHGHGPQRAIQTGIGPVEVRRAKVRDRATSPRRSESASPRRSCRSGRGGPRAWMRCCRCSTCAGSRPATSRRRSARCWARMRRTCLRRDRPADGGVAGRIRALGRSAICRRGVTCTCGRTASTCRRAWKTMPNACWC